MPSNDDRKSQTSNVASDADSPAWRDDGSAVWSDDGLDAFAGPVRLPKGMASEAFSADVTSDAEALAEFEAAPGDEEPPAAPGVDEPPAVLPPPQRRGALSGALYLGGSVLCIGAAMALGLGYLWPDVSSEPAPERSQKVTVPWSLGPAPTTERADEAPRATADEGTPMPIVTPRAAVAVASAAGEETVELPAIDAPPVVEALDVSSIETWSTLAATAVAAEAEVADTTETVPGAPAEAADEAAVDRSEINRLLRAYEDAHDRRDAAAVAALWPTTNADDLTRAFSSVKQQDLSFDHCTTTELTVDHGIVECPGEIRFVRQVGSDRLQVRRAVWTISVARTSDHWSVRNVVVR